MLLLCGYYASIVLFTGYYCVIIYVSIVRVLCDYCAIIVWLLCDYWVINVLLLCDYCVIIVWYGVIIVVLYCD